MNIGAFYRLTKPGVLYGNALTTVAGFLFASKGAIDFRLFLATVAGSTLIIASATTINNHLDQDIDRLMARTKKRGLITGEVKPLHALIFGILMCLIGAAILAMYVSWLVLVIGLIGFVDYVWLYGALAKRRSMYGTLVGSVSGAVPILAGYAAASGGLDLGSWLVFAVLFFWQMPEFYSIAIFRRKEYAAANIPVISVVRGIHETKKHILFFTVLFVLATLGLSVFGYTDIFFTVVMGFLGLYWINLGIKGFSASDNALWAKRMFRFSLIILLVFCALISFEYYIP